MAAAVPAAAWEYETCLKQLHVRPADACLQADGKLQQQVSKAEDMYKSQRPDLQRSAARQARAAVH